MIAQRVMDIDTVLVRNVYSLLSALIAAILFAIVCISFQQCLHLFQYAVTELRVGFHCNCI